MLSGLEADRALDRARIEALDARILDLEHSLSALRAEKALVQERLFSYKYPVLSLANEIVSEIFIRVLPYPRCPPLFGILSPTSLTRICRQWREVALSTPELWRAISLSSYVIPFERRAPVYDLWLKRSRSSPLSLNHGGGVEDPVQALALIIPHRARWEYAKLCISAAHLGQIEGRMPLLRHLDLEVGFGATDLVTFGELPLLRSVVLNDVAASRAVLPWSQLTSLALIRVHLYECLPILQQTSNLAHCELRLFVSDEDSDVITLPRLESLAFSDPGHQPVTNYLEVFIAPALRSLRIPERFLGSSPIDALTLFISKSGSNLQDVHITGETSVPKNTYREALHSIPRVSFSRDHDCVRAGKELEIERESDSDSQEYY
ncbi:hypothetical protein K438DRAFT_18091 [Mycena galopus ATCC 62051]|nr:hypothetical protein K438DRAFT_18091 [Mycena galopus ATCC 62051]